MKTLTWFFLLLITLFYSCKRQNNFSSNKEEGQIVWHDQRAEIIYPKSQDIPAEEITSDIGRTKILNEGNKAVMEEAMNFYWAAIK